MSKNHLKLNTYKDANTDNQLTQFCCVRTPMSLTVTGRNENNATSINLYSEVYSISKLVIK